MQVCWCSSANPLGCYCHRICSWKTMFLSSVGDAFCVSLHPSLFFLPLLEWIRHEENWNVGKLKVRAEKWGLLSLLAGNFFSRMINAEVFVGWTVFPCLRDLGGLLKTNSEYLIRGRSTKLVKKESMPSCLLGLSHSLIKWIKTANAAGVKRDGNTSGSAGCFFSCF